jgi:hypothetical protein
VQQTAIETNKAAPSAGGDAELARLAALLNAAYARERAAFAAAVHAEANGATLAEVDAIEETARPLHREAMRHAEAMLACHAEGLTGLFALSDAIVCALGEEGELDQPELQFPDEPDVAALLFKLVRDVRRLRSVARPNMEAQSITKREA